MALSFLPMAAGQAVQTVAQGPLPAMATQAASVAGAVISAGTATATGIAEGLREDEPLQKSLAEETRVVRRGLRTRA
jgi:hypothetical protein